MIELCSHDNCTGCGACYNICPQRAIKFKNDMEGFSYPQINTEKCVGCGQCLSVCPQLREMDMEDFKGNLCYAAWSNDETLRARSSSGGIFAALAKEILSRNGVVFGTTIQDDFYVCHIKVDSLEKLSKIQGSKYVQSDIRDTFRQCRDEIQKGRLVLFSGTPCQIDGLMYFLKKKPDNLLTVDILCHGVPSRKILFSYVESIEHRYGKKVKKFDFRDKTTCKGWENSCHTRIELDDGTVVNSDSESILFWDSFLSNIYLRKNCYHCAYAGKKRVGDITIGDFWGIKNLSDENKFKGVSLILINTDKGNEFVQDIDVSLETRKIDEAIGKNQTLETPFAEGPNRDRFFSDLDNGDFKKAVYRAIPKRMLKNNVFIFIHKLIGDKAYRKVRKILLRK